MSHTWGSGQRLDGGSAKQPSAKPDKPRSKGMTFFTNTQQQKATERAARTKKEDLKPGTGTLDHFLSLNSPNKSKAPISKKPKSYIAQNGVASSSKVELGDTVKPKGVTIDNKAKKKDGKEQEAPKPPEKRRKIVDLTGSQSDDSSSSEDERPSKKKLKQKTLDKAVIVSPIRIKPKPAVLNVRPTAHQVEMRFFDMTIAELEDMLEREEGKDAVFIENKTAKEIARSQLAEAEDKIMAYVTIKEFQWEEAAEKL